ncbi:hypothetical protein ACWDTT_33235 [Streptosporangium sandarakinum]
MAMIYPLGPFYAQPMRMRPRAPLVQLGSTQETAYPYRSGRCVVIRLGRRALAFGMWTGQAESEDLAMALAVNARVDDDMFDDDGGLNERFERHLARRNVARSVSLIEDEWKIVSALDLLADYADEDAYDDEEDV